MYAVLCVVLLIPALCQGSNESCTVVPRDQYIEKGSDLTLGCWSGCVSHRTGWPTPNIYWKLNNNRSVDGFSSSVNSTYTSLTLRNFSLHSATLECYTAPPELIVGGTTIRTYTKPRNISCVLKYVNKVNGSPNRITCDWEHVETSAMKVFYSTEIKQSGDSSESTTCVSKTTTCTTDYHPSLLHTIFIVTVTAKTRGWVAEATAHFELLDILQLAPPTLTVTPQPNRLLVEWKLAQKFSSHTVRCQARYKSTHGNISERVLDASLNPGARGGHVKIEDVESCTRYRVSARCALPNAPWSEWSLEMTALSMLNNNTFKLNLWRKVGKPNINGNRRVVLMWEGVPLGCSANFTYSIDRLPDGPINTNTFFVSDEGVHTANACSPTTCEVDVNEDAKTIKFRLYNNTELIREESVYVPATGEGVPQVSHIQSSAQGGGIKVRWAAPNQTLSGFMVDWTSDGLHYYWREVSDTRTTLTGLQNFTLYNISVTPLFNNKTGLEKQAAPICSTERVPDAIFIEGVQSRDRSALVTWSLSPRRQCSSVIISYNIFYHDPVNQFNVTVQDGKNKEVLLERLQPATKYHVYVEAVSLAGSRSSAVRHFETKSFDTSLILILGVCGGVVLLIVLLIILCCALQYKKMVPNPGLSSLAEWSCQNYQKIITNPSESLDVCEKVHSCELIPSPICRQLLALSHTQAADGEPTSDHTQQPSPSFSETSFSDGPESDPEDEPGDKPGLQLDIHHQGPPTEPAEHPVQEPSSAYAYRSQEGGTSPGVMEDFPDPLAQGPTAKTAPLTAYVTVDMFEPPPGS